MNPHYRVTIIGLARINEGDEAYRDVFDIVTGGGPGLMQAANPGSKRFVERLEGCDRL